jgi:outer membrane protein assembly factor BamD (BamD/ComL family)
VDEYKVITGLWENEPDTYKAYFMQGFVLSEYQKNDSLALLAFEEMLRKYPNSELSDDAKIMVDNIKSGGKVLEDLIKKIEASSSEEEP